MRVYMAGFIAVVVRLAKVGGFPRVSGNIAAGIILDSDVSGSGSGSD